MVDSFPLRAVSVASFTVLLYDQLLTLSEEVEYVWSSKAKERVGYSIGSILFFIVLSSIGDISADGCIFLSTLHNGCEHFIIFERVVTYTGLTWCCPSRCNRFARYEGVTYCVSIIVAGLMMIVRVNVLYEKSMTVMIAVSTLWCLQIGTFIFFLSGGEALPKDGISGGCAFIFKPSLGRLDILAIVGTLVFDSVILSLVAFKTFTYKDPVQQSFGESSHPGCERRTFTYIAYNCMLQEGAIYYCVICGINLSLTIMIATAAPGIRNVLTLYAFSTRMLFPQMKLISRPKAV
ncbi:hypothetical protein SCHPADRAFT_941780 [Schizopora paradoxa]|uniref:DUF6533 domain-containing protein n=1 Tax=Schizopora paradoxa TaxID=27342 RepID=A0A0H2RJH3_9AGAM|nr:hypothetical protein SCHPADRAFT_941780 [Schizopora paradoxa]